MITAKKAKERTISSFMELTRQLIETRIEAKITAGMRQCEITFSIPEKIADELTKKGYKISTRGSSAKNRYYIISW